VYERLDDRDSALSAYREAIRLTPDYALAHYALGVLHINLGDSDAAMAEYVTLINLNKKLADKLLERIRD